MFFHYVSCLFILLTISLAVQNLFSLIKSHLFYFSFVSFAWGDTSDKKFLWTMSKILLPMFSYEIFTIWGLTFKFVIHFKFILVCTVWRWSRFIFLCISIQFSQHHLLNKLSLPIACACFLCQILIDCKGVGLFLSSLFCPIDLCVCFYASTILFWKQVLVRMWT